jgi:hypothetical protein
MPGGSSSIGVSGAYAVVIFLNSFDVILGMD